MSIHIRKLRAGLGAEIGGINLSEPVDERGLQLIRRALDEHGVLALPNQPIDDDAHVRFARGFGTLQTFRPRKEPGGLPPEIFRSSNADDAGNIRAPSADDIKLLKLNWLWHADTCYRAVPSRGVVLRAVEMVSAGGDTVFANNTASYEALPEALQRRIAGLSVLHSFEFLVRTQDVPPLSPEEMGRLPRAIHPLVRRHPDGRKSLFLSPPYMESVVGWDRSASRALFEELLAVATQERFLYRHKWAPDDVLVWNNEWTMHHVTPFDAGSERRTMHGATIVGTSAFGGSE